MENINPDEVPPEKKRTESCSRYSTHKAGMEGLDKNTVLQIIQDASKGSKFYEHELQREKQLQQQIQQKLSRICTLTPDELSDGEAAADELLQSIEKRRLFDRSIVHLDMDAFYAAVEIRDQPDLRHHPVAVGSNSMLSTSNYVARRFGVRAGLPGFIGKKLCPSLRILPLDFSRYTAASQVVRNVLRTYVEAPPLDATDSVDESGSGGVRQSHSLVAMVTTSLDEAYLDLTYHLRQRASWPDERRTYWPRPSPQANMLVCHCSDRKSRLRELQQTAESDSLSKAEHGAPGVPTDKRVAQCSRPSDLELAVCANCGLLLQNGRRVFGTSAWDAVREMRFRVFCATQLTCSAGIGPNTLIAKIASDWTKPSGQHEVPSTLEAVNEFVRNLAVRKVPGIGHVTERRLEAFGVRTCKDLVEKRGMLWHVSSTLAMTYYLRIALGHSEDHWLPSSDPHRCASGNLESFGVEDSDLPAQRVDRKSMSVERTFPDTSDTASLLQWCRKLANCLSTDLKEEHVKGRSLTLKMKLDSFEVRTRCQQLPDYTNDAELLSTFGMELLRDEITAEERKFGNGKLLTLRLMGMRASNLLPGEMCPQLRQHSLEEVITQAVLDQPRPQREPVASPSEWTVTCSRVRNSTKTSRDPHGDKRSRKSAQTNRKSVKLAQQPLSWHKPSITPSEIDDIRPIANTTMTLAGCPTGEAHSAPSDGPRASTSAVTCGVTCPVCRQQLACGEEINQHLDDCLSRTAIVEATRADSVGGTSQSTAGSATSRGHSSSKSSRKRQAGSLTPLSAKRRGSTGGESGYSVPKKPGGGPLDKFILQ